MSWRVGVDSGGTFTDVCLFDEATGRIEVWKVASTPDDPSRGIAEGVREGAGAGRCRAGGDRLFRPWHDGGDQCADPASRRAHRADHHRRVPRPAGDRPAEAARPVRPAGRQAADAGAARSAAGGAGAGAPRRLGGSAAGRSGVSRRGAPAARGGRAGGRGVLPVRLRAHRRTKQTARRILAEEFPEAFACVSHEVAPEFREFERHVHHRGERLSRPGHARLHPAPGATGCATSACARRRI